MNILDLIRKFEGLRLQAYQDSVGVWTIGYGHTSGVTQGMTCTKEQAEQWLENDFFMAKNDVKSVVRSPITDNQLDALGSFVFNLGIRRLIQSTLLKKLNAGDYVGAANEFDKWVYAGGMKLRGLVARRAAEKELFLKGE